MPVELKESEILDLIKKGESETLEFKENLGEDVIVTSCAFANTSGGIILVGVDRKGLVIGTQLGPESLNEWLNRMTNITEPRIMPDAGTVMVGGKTILVIGVKEHPFKPISCRGAATGASVPATG